MMSQVTSTSIEKSLVQEGILIASTELIKTISGKWDENSKPNAYNFEYVMYVNDAELAASDGNASRIGNVRILYTADNALRPTTGLDAGEDANSSDDVDDYATGSVDTTKTSGSEEGYKFNYKKSVAVTASATFGTLTNDANLKRATILIKDKDDNDLVKLYTYVANSGSANSLSRTLP